MKRLKLLLIAIAALCSTAKAETEYTQVSELTTNFFVMAYDDGGTYKSPYWTVAHAQNVCTPAESSTICGGDVNYYLFKAEPVTYNDQTCYRIGIYNKAHAAFSGVGGGCYLNSAGWVFFSGVSEAEGKSHVYGQDGDALGIFNITYTEGKGFQFQCVSNSKYINGTFGHSGTADKYFWHCFAEGDLYNDIAALTTSPAYLAYAEMKDKLDALVANTDDYDVDDTYRDALHTALSQASTDIKSIGSEADITSVITNLKSAAITFINNIRVKKGCDVDVSGLVTNSGFAGNAAYGWNGTEPGFQSYTNAEFFAKKYDFKQTLSGMPAGVYEIRVQAFERPNSSGTTALSTYLDGTASTDAYLYIGDQSTAICHVGKCAQSDNTFGGTKYTVNEVTYYMPNNMSEAAKFFSNSQYWNSVKVVLEEGGEIKFGLKCDVSTWGWWTCFDSFQLYYLGESDTTGEEPEEGSYFNYTKYLSNPSFEDGNTGWTYNKVGDTGVKENTGVYATTGTDGDYLFNAYTISESNVFDTQALYVSQTIEGLPAGEYHLKAYTASNTYSYGINTPVTLFANTYTSSIVPKQSSSFGEVELVFYLTPDEETVNLGMRSASWFKADNFRLYWYGRTSAYEQARRLAVVERYEEIASQAIDRTSYDAVLENVRSALMAEEITDAQVAEQNAILRTALIDLIKNGTTESGQFDITALMENPEFEMNTNGWGTTGVNISWTGTGEAQVVGNKEAANIFQTLEAMPAGHYTLKAQALYRPTSTAMALERFENGICDEKANLVINGEKTTIIDVISGGRYAVSSTLDIYSTIDGRGFPTSSTTASEAFVKGDYWNIIETDIDEDGTITVGIDVDATELADSWLMFDNFKLLYGTTPQVIVNKVVEENVLTPVCLPFDITEDEIGEIYAVGSITGNEAQIYRVSNMKAGVPCVVKANRSIDQFNVKATDITERQNDKVLLPWDGGTLTGTNDYSWTNTQVDGKVKSANTLTFNVVDWIDVDITVDMENLGARKFIGENTYTDDNSSVIGKYQTAPPARRDQPNNVSVPIPANSASVITVSLTDGDGNEVSAETTVNGNLAYIRNLVPQQTYNYILKGDGAELSKGTIHTEGNLRMMYVPSISNVRDLGGWTAADGRKVRYGKVYRGGELNGDHVATQTDIQRLKDYGVGAEIDLRIDADNKGAGVSVFGFTKPETFYYANANDFHFENMSDETSHGHWRDEFNLTVNNLAQGKSVYFHCIWGADRTGLYAMLLEGLLGLPVDAIYKDYELTSYSLAGGRWKENMKPMVQYIEALEGATLQQKYNTFFVDQLGVEQSTIDLFREIMLEPSEGITRTVSTSGQYGTICLPYAATVEGADLFVAKGVDNKETPTKLYIEDAGNELQPGKAYIYQSISDENVKFNYTGSEWTELVGNEPLLGNYVTTKATAGNYVLSAGTWHLVVDGKQPTITPYHAELRLAELPIISQEAGVKAMDVSNVNTAIRNVDESNGLPTYYDLQGRKVESPSKGLFIINVNGKTTKIFIR